MADIKVSRLFQVSMSVVMTTKKLKMRESGQRSRRSECDSYQHLDDSNCANTPSGGAKIGRVHFRCFLFLQIPKL